MFVFILQRPQPAFKYNYTLYKNAGFWLVICRDIFLQIQALQ
jgi:hypothetical protein